jgi:hypothetical protein
MSTKKVWHIPFLESNSRILFENSYPETKEKSKSLFILPLLSGPLHDYSLAGSHSLHTSCLFTFSSRFKPFFATTSSLGLYIRHE